MKSPLLPFFANLVPFRPSDVAPNNISFLYLHSLRRSFLPLFFLHPTTFPMLKKRGASLLTTSFSALPFMRCLPCSYTYKMMLLLLPLLLLLLLLVEVVVL